MVTSTTDEPDVAAPPRDATHMQRCLACGHDNPHVANFCNECGLQLNLRFCQHCDAVNARAALTCYKCGNAFPAAVPFNGMAEHPPAMASAMFSGDDVQASPAPERTDPSLGAERPAVPEDEAPLAPAIFATRGDAEETAGDRDDAGPVAPDLPARASIRWPGRIALTLILLPLAAILVVGMLPPLQRPVAHWMRAAGETARARETPAAVLPSPAASAVTPTPERPGAQPGAGAVDPSAHAPGNAASSAPAGSATVPVTTPPLARADTVGPAQGSTEPVPRNVNDAAPNAVAPTDPPAPPAVAPTAAAAAAAAAGATAAAASATAQRPPAKAGAGRSNAKGSRAAPTAPATRGPRASPTAPRRTPTPSLRRTSAGASCGQDAALLGLCS
jgi:hypothetical protein